MSDFKLFDQIFNKYENTNDFIPENDSIEDCIHINTTNEKGTEVCMDCGEEVSKNRSQPDSKHSLDPNRLQARKIEERSIYKDVENMGFSEKIISEANKIYFQVTKGQIFRGNSRKSLIFATIFHAHKVAGRALSHDTLINIFNLSRKAGLKGLKHVNLYAPKDSNIRTVYITPVDLVNDIMDKFSATDAQKKEVVELYEKIKNKSSRLNRARPQSVSSSLIYYWIRSKNKEITLKQFTKKVSLSELTISKIAREISEVLGTGDTLKL